MPGFCARRFAANTRHLMRLRRWTDSRLAREAGLTPETVSRVLNAEKTTYETQLKVAVGLGYDLHVLAYSSIEIINRTWDAARGAMLQRTFQEVA